MDMKVSLRFLQAEIITTYNDIVSTLLQNLDEDSGKIEIDYKEIKHFMDEMEKSLIVFAHCSEDGNTHSNDIEWVNTFKIEEL
jgi:cell division GTPase FtsZ